MKHFVLLFGLIMAQILGLQAQGNIYFHKDGHTQSWELNEVDSLTYLKPTSEVILPKSLTLASGTHGRLGVSVFVEIDISLCLQTKDLRHNQAKK